MASEMTTRTTTRTVIFAEPFRLGAVEGVQPPGSYEVITDEELIDGLTFQAWRRVATMIVLPRVGEIQMVLIDPTDLDASFLQDPL